MLRVLHVRRIWAMRASGSIPYADIAKMFAETHWDRPRKPTKMLTGRTFKVRDGLSTYRVDYADGEFIVYEL